MNNNMINELKDIKIDEFIWSIFIFSGIIGIISSEYRKKYIIDNNIYYLLKSKNIRIFLLIISLILNIYFVKRNQLEYDNTKSLQEKNRLKIKLFGNYLLLIGTICLFYFQINNSSLGDEILL